MNDKCSSLDGVLNTTNELELKREDILPSLLLSNMTRNGFIGRSSSPLSVHAALLIKSNLICYPRHWSLDAYSMSWQITAVVVAYNKSLRKLRL